MPIAHPIPEYPLGLAKAYRGRPIGSGAAHSRLRAVALAAAFTTVLWGVGLLGAGPAAAADAANNAPIANPDTATVESGKTALVDVLANDTDPDGDALTLQEAYLPVPDAGTARALSGKVEVTIAAGFVGSVQVVYRIADTSGAQVNGMLDLNVVPGSDQPTNPPTTANTRPIAVDDDLSTEHDTPVSVDLLANDTDPDGDSLTLVKIGRAKHGSITRAGSTITYTPKAGFAGTDHFTYTIADARGKRATGTVHIVVLEAPGGQEPPSGGTAVTKHDVERALDRLGLPTGSVNGHYDAKTRRAMCTWRTVMGRTANRALPSAAEARAIVAQDALPAALGSMATGLNVSKTCQAAFWVSSADRYRAIMPATTGKPGYSTRAGVHHVFIAWHVWRYSTIYEGARMYKPMQFSGGQAVHGSAKDSYVKTWPASHGCVRMLHRDIDRLQDGGFGLGSTVRVFGAW